MICHHCREEAEFLYYGRWCKRCWKLHTIAELFKASEAYHADEEKEQKRSALRGAVRRLRREGATVANVANRLQITYSMARELLLDEGRTPPKKSTESS